MKKSTTQMTKTELLDLLKQKDQIIAELNAKIDDLESLAVTSDAVPLDSDTSRMLSSMNQRIRALEEKLNSQ